MSETLAAAVSSVANANGTPVTLCACGSLTVRSADGAVTTTPGCRAATTRTFAPGHDARLKGNLIRLELAGGSVKVPNGNAFVSPTVWVGGAHPGLREAVRAGVVRGNEQAEARAERAAKREAEAAARKATREAAAAAKREAKAAKAAAKVASANADAFAALAAEVAPAPAPAPEPQTVTAKVGRWTYDGTLSADGKEFTFTDKRGREVTTRKFAV